VSGSLIVGKAALLTLGALTSRVTTTFCACLHPDFHFVRKQTATISPLYHHQPASSTNNGLPSHCWCSAPSCSCSCAYPSHRPGSPALRRRSSFLPSEWPALRPHGPRPRWARLARCLRRSSRSSSPLRWVKILSKGKRMFCRRHWPLNRCKSVQSHWIEPRYRIWCAATQATYRRSH
jgi:hypothetical protein